MHKKTISVLIALVILLATTMPAAAITGGQPDGNRHPYGALLLVPGETFCSGTLIDEDVVLTAGHCTSGWDADEVFVTFDTVASVDENWEITGGTWYSVEQVITHPDYDDAAWPFTPDYGIVILEEAVVGITPATLPTANLLDPIIEGNGQTPQRFVDVGYGINGVTMDVKPYLPNVDWTRKFSVQRFNPSNGAVGTQDPLWLILQNVPSPNKGGACGGDSGSGVFLEGTNTIVAVHTGGYRLGYNGYLCGRMTSLNHRIDDPAILNWILGYVD